MPRRFAVRTCLALAAGLTLPACGSSPSQNASGGSSGAGGAASGGATAGATSSGGSWSGGGSYGGASSGSGGMLSTGGRADTGGHDATGGNGTGGRAGSSGGAMGSGGAATDGGADAAGGAAGHTGKWQMMTLGDSITETTCYPQFLSQALSKNGRTNFAFIGTRQANQDCGGIAPVPTEGHGGYLATYLTSDSHKSENRGTMTELLAWAAEKPEVVLMEYGTNDCWTASIPISEITKAFSFVLEKFRAQNPKVIFFVAQITPLNPDGCSTCESRVESLNAQIPAWATSVTTADSPVYVVDVFSALDPKTYVPNSTWTRDGCHPLPPAAQLMADKWLAALTAQGLP